MKKEPKGIYCPSVVEALNKYEKTSFINRNFDEDIFVDEAKYKDNLVKIDNMISQLKTIRKDVLLIPFYNHNQNEKYKIIRNILGTKRFEMSGYESERGKVTIFNNRIIELFAPLGIYDTTEMVHIDFNKGCGTLYIQMYGIDESINQFDVTGWKTVEIIDFIIIKTVLQGLPFTRRREW